MGDGNRGLHEFRRNRRDAVRVESYLCEREIAVSGSGGDGGGIVGGTRSMQAPPPLNGLWSLLLFGPVELRGSRKYSEHELQRTLYPSIIYDTQYVHGLSILCTGKCGC